MSRDGPIGEAGDRPHGAGPAAAARGPARPLLRALRAWLPPGARGRAGPPPAPTRWAVIDVETTGLDPGADRLLAIGAVAVVDGRIALADSFEAVIAQPQASARENILVHGIAEAAQRDGEPAAPVLAAFARWLGDAVPVAFHASFDRAFLARAWAANDQWVRTRGWVDLAALAPALRPQADARTFDGWLARAGIEVAHRHEAAADAMAAAQLLLWLLGELPPAERDEAGVRRVLAQARWLGGR